MLAMLIWRLKSKKVVIVTRPEFGPELVGCLMQIVKVLYGLNFSGARWHNKFADAMRDNGWLPCKTEPDLWLMYAGDHY